MHAGTHSQAGSRTATVVGVSALEATSTAVVSRRTEPGYRRLSLYTHVLIANAGVLIAATTVLALTPATGSIPREAEEALVLGLGLTVIVVANAFLLRVSFGPLARLV